MSQDSEHQAKAQVAAIQELIRAVEVDFDELSLLLELDEDSPRLAELLEAAGEFTSLDEALEAIQGDPLSVEVRSGWGQPGGDMEPTEFRILLCTGGPHVELRGSLNVCMNPSSVYVFHQDWFEAESCLPLGPAEHDSVMTYVHHFYFGE